MAPTFDSGIGAISTDDFSRQAEVLATNWRATAATLFREMQLNPPVYGPGERAYVTPEEATIDLGLSNVHQRAAVAGIREIVKDTRSMMAIAQEWRDLGLSQPVLRELLKRAKRLTAELRTRRSWVAKAAPAGGGWEAIPKGKSGGYRRRKSAGGYEYSYPDGKGGHTEHASPAADEDDDVHDDHEYATPDGKVSEEHKRLRSKAREAGLSLSGELNSSSSMKHMKQLEARLDRAIAAKRKTDAGGAGDAAEASEGKQAAADTPEAEDGAEEAPDAKPDAELTALAERKGVSQDVIVEALGHAEFKTPKGIEALKAHFEGLPDIDSVSDEPVEGGDKAALLAHIEKLEATLDELEERLGDKVDAAAIKAARAEAKAVRGRTTPRGSMSLATRVWGLAVLGLGFTAGLMLGGPIMGLMAMTVADKWMKEFGVPGEGKANEVADRLKGPPKGDNPDSDDSAKADDDDKVKKDAEGEKKPVKKPVKKGLILVSVGGCLLRKSAVDTLLKAERPKGGGWAAVPGGKKGGYRKRGAGGKWEYWYPGGRAATSHVRHHTEQLAEQKQRHAAFAGGRAPQSVMDSVQTQIDLHTEALAAATEAQDTRNAKFGDRHGQAHRGRRTLGVDPGIVHSAAADLMGNQVGERSLGTAKQARYGEALFDQATEVRVETVTGVSRNLKVTLRASGNPGFSGHLASKMQPQYNVREDRFDHDDLRSVPHAIVVNVPRVFHGSREEFGQQMRKVLSHELAHAIDELTSGHQKRDTQKYNEGAEHYYNDPAEIVAFRHNIFRELNDPKVKADVLASTEIKPKRRRGEPAPPPIPEGERAYESLSNGIAMELIRVHSPTWGRVVPHLNEKSRKKLLESAVAVLQGHADGTSKPVRKSGVNEYGHRYDLTPAHTLTPRAGWARDTDPVVHVRKGGEFSWNGEVYPNGTQLLKALKQTERVRVTLARYFRLGDNSSKLAKGLASALAVRYPALRCTPYNGCIRVDGPMRGTAIPEDLWTSGSAALLEPECVHDLLESSDV